MSNVTIQSSTREKLSADIKVTGDPTATAPEVAVLSCTDPRADPDNADYADGAWSLAGWNVNTMVATIETPTIGGTGSGATFVRADGDWRVWFRLTVGSELVVRKGGVVKIRSG